MRRNLLALLVCVLLCLMVLPGTASADSGPKPAVTITVVNAPAGEYYLDLLVTDPATMQTSIRQTTTQSSPRLRDWEVDGWYPAWREAPAFLCSEICGRGRTVPIVLPTTACPAPFVSPSPAQTGPRPRTSLYPHGVLHPSDVRLGDQLHYKGHLPDGFYGVQFLSTLVPTLLVEGGLLWLFGFRARRDWLVFLAVNLVTQRGSTCGLRQTWFPSAILPSVSGAPRGGGAYFAGGADCLCVPAEGVQRLRRAAYAACANIASYAVGYLPLHWAVEFLAR